MMDITNYESVWNFFDKNRFDIIIHCAALARMSECESEPAKAIDVNIIGTANLVKSALRKQNETKKEIRFILISTDGVYDGKDGNFSEFSPTIPYNRYGWTKLGS